MRAAARFLPARLRARCDRWLFRSGGAAAREVVLVQRRVFILPTRQGLVYAGILALMLAASINYALSLGYVLTFLLAAMGVNAMLHTWRNLALLRAAAGPCEPVFCGDPAVFVVELDNRTSHPRHAVTLSRDGQDASPLDLPARAIRRATLAVPTTQRGVLRAGRLVLHTRFPLGLYRAWSSLELDLGCLVYPRPAPPGLPLPATGAAQHGPALPAAGDDDFGGLRPYRRGDALRHVAWKATARDDALLTKQFAGRATVECWLAWEALPAAWDTERRLAQLARWVIDADRAGLGYGLSLPGRRIPLGSGPVQRRRCLEALARHEQPHG